MNGAPAAGGGAAALHPLAGTIVRLANEAPFEDVRIACAALVRVLNGVRRCVWRGTACGRAD